MCAPCLYTHSMYFTVLYTPAGWLAGYLSTKLLSLNSTSLRPPPCGFPPAAPFPLPRVLLSHWLHHCCHNRSQHNIWKPWEVQISQCPSDFIFAHTSLKQTLLVVDRLHFWPFKTVTFSKCYQCCVCCWSISKDFQSLSHIEKNMEILSVQLHVRLDRILLWQSGGISGKRRKSMRSHLERSSCKRRRKNRGG